MRPRQFVLASSLAFALACAPVAMGAVYAEPAGETTVEAEGTMVESTDEETVTEAEGTLPEPADYDKADFYEEAPAAAARTVASSRASSLSPVDVSAEMKYFTKYESHANYRQGFGYGDGYNALGYYQFDRRYSLISFLTAVYNYNPTKYSMFKDVLARRSEVSSSSVSMYDTKTGKLTGLGQLVQDAWYAAYDADPAEFSALQDSYAYNSYYVPTENWLKSQGIDISGRADCVKGMVWGLSNMWGTGGVRNVLLGANLSNDMTDREFVTALSQQITDHIEKYSSQTEYYAGWKNRYRSELADCLAYIAEDEAAAAEEEKPAPEPAPETPGDTGEQGSGANQGDSSDAGDQGSDTGASDADDSTGNENAGSNGDAPSEDTSENTGDDATDTDSSDTSDDSSSGTSPVPSDPNPVPPSNAVSGGTSTSKPNNAPSDGTTATDDATSSDDGDRDAATDDSTSSSTSTSTDEEKDASTSGASANKEGEEKPGDKTSDSQKQAEQAKKANGGSSENGAVDNDEAGAHPNGVMPQTSDLIMFTCFASASAACFGATFVYAGKRGLKKNEDDDANEE
ncbi:hypothetical protein [uncultured Enorma sp.]|uniref:VgrG-related protein n=1 Tax=uncultured Enorma sp. TaxID=1714346 RepID=UPI002626A57E|nr:hypothetical protein [uncultured Enorma sp.]